MIRLLLKTIRFHNIWNADLLVLVIVLVLVLVLVLVIVLVLELVYHKERLRDT